MNKILVPKVLNFIFSSIIIYYTVSDVVEVSLRFRTDVTGDVSFIPDAKKCTAKANISLANIKYINSKVTQVSDDQFVDWSYINKKYPVIVGFLADNKAGTLLFQSYDKKGFLCSESEFATYDLKKSGSIIKFQIDKFFKEAVSSERKNELNSYGCSDPIVELCLIPFGQVEGEVIYTSINRTAPESLYHYLPDRVSDSLITDDPVYARIEALTYAYSGKLTEAIAILNKILERSLLIANECVFSKHVRADLMLFQEEVHTRRLLALYYIMNQSFELANAQYQQIFKLETCIKEFDKSFYKANLDKYQIDAKYDLLLATYVQAAALSVGSDKMHELIKLLEEMFKDTFKSTVCSGRAGIPICTHQDLEPFDKKIGLPGIFWQAKILEFSGDKTCSDKLFNYVYAKHESRSWSYPNTRPLNFVEEQLLNRALNRKTESTQELTRCLGLPGTVGKCIYGIADLQNYSESSSFYQ